MKKVKNISTPVFILSLLAAISMIAFLTLLLNLERNLSIEKGGIHTPSLISEMPEVEAGNYDVSLGIKCFDDWSFWKSSTNFKADAPWSTAFMANDPVSPASGSNDNQYGRNYYFDFKTDLNGDGLPDYTYVVRSGNTTMKDCVYLSNGQGWTLSYRCVYSGNKFYGDCADTSI